MTEHVNDDKIKDKAFSAGADALEFDVQMDASILYDYYMYHTYRSFTGILGTVVGLLLIANFSVNKEVIYLIFGIIVVLYLPVTLGFSCRKQMLTVEAYKSPLHYRVGENGIEISQGELSQGREWAGVIKAAADAKSIFLYTNRNVATILPRSSMGDKTQEVIKLICKSMDPGKVKIRF